MSPAIETFCEFFQGLSVDNLSEIPKVYAADVEFLDPAHHILGAHNLQRYFEGMMGNITQCSFDIQQVIEHDGEAYIRWQMDFSHPRLNSGRPVSVPGVSHLKYSEQIDYHRDYMDMGAMLYEHVPLLGSVVKNIKQRLAA